MGAAVPTEVGGTKAGAALACRRHDWQSPPLSKTKPARVVGQRPISARQPEVIIALQKMVRATGSIRGEEHRANAITSPETRPGR
jgi:hypothetical protein